jgi:hypothetical protein
MYEKKMDFLRIADMIFSIGVWKNKLNLDIFNNHLYIKKWNQNCCFRYYRETNFVYKKKTSL